MKLTVLLPANMLPLGSIVTKKTGKAEFKIANEVRIFDDRVEKVGEPQRKNIKAAEGTLLLISIDHAGDISAINADAIVAWHAEEEELSQWLHDRQMEREDK